MVKFTGNAIFFADNESRHLLLSKPLKGTDKSISDNLKTTVKYTFTNLEFIINIRNLVFTDLFICISLL